MLEKIFKLSENNTSVKTEILAGVTTFLTMAYIIFLQPAVLSGTLFGTETGMDFGAVTTATCLAAMLATVIMGLYARYPIAQAPGMGENFFFVFNVLAAAALLPAVKSGETTAWQVGLGVVFVSGIFFLILSLLKVREMIINAISPSMKNGIAVGIGLFIAFIGLQNASLIIKDPGTAVKLNSALDSPDILIFFFGLFVMCILHVRKVKGSILIGIISATLLSVILKLSLSALDPETHPRIAESMLMTRFSFATKVFSKPPSLAPTFMKMDIVNALSSQMIPFIIIFLFMDIFDTIGTLIGVSEQAGLIKDNKLPRAGRAMASDAIGTVAGACLGTSTVTSFIESAAGVEQGGRTGLTAVTAGLLFLIAPFFTPVIAMVGSYAPITAPALVLVGSMMIRNIRKIDWDDYSESIPAFLAMIGIPLTYSIADGLALGFISYAVIKLFSGRAKEISWLTYVLGFILLLYFIFIRTSIE